MPPRKRNIEPKKRKPDVPVMELGSMGKERKPPEFEVRIYTCCNATCQRVEANEMYEFVSPGHWQCERCWKKERDNGRPS